MNNDFPVAFSDKAVFTEDSYGGYLVTDDNRHGILIDNCGNGRKKPVDCFASCLNQGIPVGSYVSNESWLFFSFDRGGLVSADLNNDILLDIVKSLGFCHKQNMLPPNMVVSPAVLDFDRIWFSGTDIYFLGWDDFVIEEAEESLGRLLAQITALEDKTLGNLVDLYEKESTIEIDRQLLKIIINEHKNSPS